MTGLDEDNPLIGLISEEQYLEENNVENGDLLCNSKDSSSSPETETASPKEEDDLNEDDRLQSSSSYESVGAASDADESVTETSSPDSSTRMALVGGVSSDQCYNGWMAAGVHEILFEPDFVAYQKVYSTVCELIFSASCIEAKGVAAHGDRENFHIYLKIDDIVEIESQWLGRFQTARVKVRAVSERLGAENNNIYSGIKKLEFAVTDVCWYQKCEAIRSLDLRYNALWKVVVDTELEEYGETLGQLTLPFRSSYFPDFKPFEDFIYPEGDVDAVSVSKRDVDLLQPDTFVNDTIIDFYIKYLKDKMPPEKRQRFHFFNSFFFRKLADLDKYPSGSFDGRAAFLRVRKWTRKVNLFEKDFIFIPVNHSYHWSLLVICHPGEVASFRDEDAQKLARVPCILHMDSIRGTHVDLKDRVQSYLWEEWKERQMETSEDISSKFSNMRFVSLELPQQQNSYDCGLFLLHYVEQFLEEDPANISPFKITTLSVFLGAYWFPSSEPSLKRRDIQKLIYDLLENHSEESSPASSADKCYPRKSPKSGNATEFLPESSGTSKGYSVNLLCTQAQKGVEMALFPASSLRASCADDSGMASRDAYNSGSAAGSLIELQYQAFDRMASFNELKSAMASLQCCQEDGLQHLGGISTEACNYPCPSRDFKNEVSWDQEIPMHQTLQENHDSVPVASICGTEKSLDGRVDENFQVTRELSFDNEGNLTNKSTENVQELTDRLASAQSNMLEIADPRSSFQSFDQHDNSDPLKACAKILYESFNGGNGVDRNGGTTSNDVDDLALESHVEHAAKKLRLTPISEEVTKGLPEDFCL
nr:probable ubiquitin-like-specific protease 2B isoform X1 [Coffea arabica]XP_027093432.1 probable ubiquitin-like-specific protease 2B isoform X1 [Coffea arabica]